MSHANSLNHTAVMLKELGVSKTVTNKQPRELVSTPGSASQDKPLTKHERPLTSGFLDPDGADWTEDGEGSVTSGPGLPYVTPPTSARMPMPPSKRATSSGGEEAIGRQE